MDASRLREKFLSIPEVRAWPELAELFDLMEGELNPDWFLPMKACSAVGGNPITAETIGAAIACMQASIILVDDLLDDDPQGEYRNIGAGKASNLAIGLQAAAFRLIAITPVSDQQRVALLKSLSWMTIATAHGQHMDVDNVGDEEDYWRVVHSKSTPFYGAALEVGGIVGNATKATCDRLREMGLIMGEIVQLHDDLFDAFHKPAKPDWDRPQNNILMLYAMKTDHKDREEFLQLLCAFDDIRSLERAQNIIIQSGAVSYCAYLLVQRYKMLDQLSVKLDLPSSDELKVLFEAQYQPAMMLLRKTGVDIPPNEWGEISL